MTAAVIVILVLLGAVLARWMFRSLISERRSVRSYEHAMEVLGELSSHAVETGERLVKEMPGADEDGHGATAPHVIPAAAYRRGSPSTRANLPSPKPGEATAGAKRFARNLAKSLEEREKVLRPVADAVAAEVTEDGEETKVSEPEPATSRRRRGARSQKSPLVFISDELIDQVSSPASENAGASEKIAQGPEELTGESLAPPEAEAPAKPGRRHVARTRRTARVWPKVAAAAAVAAATLALALLAITGGGSSTNTRSGQSASAGHTGATSHSSSRRHQALPSPPPPPVLSPVSFDSSEAVYNAGSSNLQLVLAASGPCWVEVRQGSNGPTLFEGTLTAGESHTVQMAGPVWLRLGNASNIVISMNNMSVQLPSDAGSSPYNLTFQPA